VEYVRTVDVGAFAPDRFDWQVLADTESCVAICASSPPGSGGPAHHIHRSDQLYYVLEGELTVQLGDEEHTAGPDTVVFIPAGLPHHNINRGAEPEVHLDLIVAPPGRGEPLATPYDEAAHGGTAHGTPYLQPVDPQGFAEAGELAGFALQPLASRRTGSEDIRMYAAQIQPGGRGPSWHIHDVDQMYFILGGCLTVEVAHKRYEAGPGSLVLLPAGVPHRNWNAGDEPERHLAMLVPEPPQGQPLDLGVEFALTGEEFG
jgi:mannose-6-phosphate isomerase-like protein (cupin superfamily)